MTPLTRILHGLNAYKNAFARPISDRYDVVLLGGALGSLFSLLQALAAPIIGRLSDRYGRRTALLCCMVGNLLSVALWVAASDFRTFLASRIVGGLSEGNVQIATEIAADISDERTRGGTMALIGACFSIAFTVGPALGAALASVSTVAANPFGTAAAVSLALIAIETAYLYVYLPETRMPSSSSSETTSNGTLLEKTSKAKPQRTNSHFLLNLTHFAFLLFFSGLEFSIPFITYDVFAYSSSQTGRLLGVIGLIASVLQGSVVRRMDPLRAVQLGVLSCALAFFVLDRLTAANNLWTGMVLLAITSATVVTGLKSLSSFEASQDERGGKLGNHRSWGMYYPIQLPIPIEHIINGDAMNRTGRSSPGSHHLLFPLLVGRSSAGLPHRGSGHDRGVDLGDIWSSFAASLDIEEQSEEGGRVQERWRKQSGLTGSCWLMRGLDW